MTLTAWTSVCINIVMNNADEMDKPVTKSSGLITKKTSR